MIIIITGATHTGKTALAQRLLEKYKYPYFSIDHLKMGLIRSGNTELTPENDKKLTQYLWPILREMIKTAIENNQNLIIEGGYVPFKWRKDFTEKYLKEIEFFCLVMTPNYIENHFSDIQKYANVVEKRVSEFNYTVESLILENKYNLKMCQNYNLRYISIDNKYEINI